MFWGSEKSPEPAKEEPVLDTEPLHLSEEEKRKAWRLLALLDALTALRPEPVSLDEVDQLGLVAKGHYDLHDACAALRHGCSLDLLVIIFT